MCGIVAYTGKQQAAPILLKSLRRLEYRGYDSAGIAVAGERVAVIKRQGKLEELEKAVAASEPKGATGIGHTRWATHGEPNEINAHPQSSADGHIILVHNGIIENYLSLKDELIKRGIALKSETDTEVLANLIAIEASDQNRSLFEAVQAALQTVRGAYAIAVLDSADPGTIVAAKKSSPLAIGVGDKSFILGSDAAPIVEYTHKVIYLKDDEIAELRHDGTYKITSLGGSKIVPEILTVELDVDRLEKGNYDHFMLKEIHEQPAVMQETIRGRLSLDQRTVLLGGIVDYEQRILRASKITIIACGTSWHAGLVGKSVIEQLAGIPVEVEYASEFRYGHSPIRGDDVVLAISQSGETADTLAGVERAKAAGALTLGIVNVVGSSIARATDGGVYTHAGPEVSVASTKAFTAQVSVLILMALRFAQQLGSRPRSELQELYQEFARIPGQIEELLNQSAKIKKLAKSISQHQLILFLGRGDGFAVALEGSLKLKELTYLAAEGYPAGELKHGPIALVTQGTPVFVVMPQGPDLAEKLMGNIQEVKARGGRIIAITNQDLTSLDIETIPVPATANSFNPLLTVVPLQLLAYYAAVELGRDVDKPRNLAKSVTVE